MGPAKRTETQFSLHLPATHVCVGSHPPQVVVTPQLSVKEPHSRPAVLQSVVCGSAWLLWHRIKFDSNVTKMPTKDSRPI